jgi:hypothetical protein
MPGVGASGQAREYCSKAATDQHSTPPMADLYIADGIRARVDQIVSDPDTAEALKPWFGSLCKRPGFHDEYHTRATRHHHHDDQRLHHSRRQPRIGRFSELSAHFPHRVIQSGPP